VSGELANGPIWQTLSAKSSEKLNAPTVVSAVDAPPALQDPQTCCRSRSRVPASMPSIQAEAQRDGWTVRGASARRSHSTLHQLRACPHPPALRAGGVPSLRSGAKHRLGLSPKAVLARSAVHVAPRRDRALRAAGRSRRCAGSALRVVGAGMVRPCVGGLSRASLGGARCAPGSMGKAHRRVALPWPKSPRPRSRQVGPCPRLPGVFSAGARGWGNGTAGALARRCGPAPGDRTVVG
jgi:hypothetical protein